MTHLSLHLSLDTLPDPALVARAKKGNPECFASLLKRYQPKVRCSVGRLLGPAKYSDLEDLEQETFLMAWRHLGQFEGRSSFRTWLTRIAINELRMKHRRKASQNISASLDQGQPGREEGEMRPAKEVVAPSPDIESWLIEEDLDKKLMKLLDELPAPLRQAVRLRMACLAEKEIAMRLDVPMGTVKARMHGARRLRQSLRQEEQARRCTGQHPASAHGVVDQRDRPGVPARV